MNREQQEVLSLLKEVDTICRKHQIMYFLSPLLTLCAVTGKPFPLHPLAGRIIMKMEDMERFREIMETELPEGRALESMKNSWRFPGLFLRYENKNTLCFRLDAGRSYQYPGIGIDLIPLRGRSGSGKIRSWDRRLETGWLQNCDNAKAEIDFYKAVCGCWVRLLSIAGRKRIGGKIYDRLCKNQITKDAKKYILHWSSNYVYEYPAEIFQETREVAWEGASFLIPRDERKYLSATFGKKYEERNFDQGFSGVNMIVSARIGYEDFLREAGSMKSLFRVRRKQFLIDTHIQRYKDYFNWCWSYAQACGSRQELRLVYSRKKEYIQNLWENRDLVRLDAVFRPCRKMMKRCLETGDVFEMDEEIMEIYLDFLRANGNTKFLEKIQQNRK